jgi:hypothetical protein
MKYEIRIFQGSRAKPRLSVNFTVDCDLTLHQVCEKVKEAIKGCDTSPARKDGDAESKEGM